MHHRSIPLHPRTAPTQKPSKIAHSDQSLLRRNQGLKRPLKFNQAAVTPHDTKPTPTWRRCEDSDRRDGDGSANHRVRPRKFPQCRHDVALFPRAHTIVTGINKGVHDSLYTSSLLFPFCCLALKVNSTVRGGHWRPVIGQELAQPAGRGGWVNTAAKGQEGGCLIGVGVRQVIRCRGRW